MKMTVGESEGRVHSVCTKFCHRSNCSVGGHSPASGLSHDPWPWPAPASPALTQVSALPRRVPRVSQLQYVPPNFRHN